MVRRTQDDEVCSSTCLVERSLDYVGVSEWRKKVSVCWMNMEWWECNCVNEYGMISKYIYLSMNMKKKQKKVS